MRPRTAAVLLSIGAMLVLSAGLAGCARRSVEAPPAPVSAPAVAAPQETPAPATPAPAAPPPALASGDLAPVFFGFDSVLLEDAARAVLDGIARRLRDLPEARITIEGHCDERGTVEYNQALGERRAQVTRDYLIAAGVSGAQIQIVSYGKERPFDEGHDEAAWASNRRAQFVLR